MADAILKTEGVDISPEAVMKSANEIGNVAIALGDGDKIRMSIGELWLAASQLEALSTALTASEKRIAELEAKVQDKRDDYEAGWYARIEAEGRF